MKKDLEKLVFATNNKHKLHEVKSIIGNRFEIMTLSDIDCHDDIPETSDTIAGNALQKARWVKEHYGYDCFADDTGLMVDALDGAPGVYSARYAGPAHDSQANMNKLLHEMERHDNRKAHFSTVIALIKDGEEHTFEGRVDGTIADTPRGDNGFGYDPVFIADETGRRFAEMTDDEKNAISHRGRAMRKLEQFLGALCLMIMFCLGAATAKAEQWRLHSTFDGDIEQIIDTPDYVYVLSNNQPLNQYVTDFKTPSRSLFRYVKDDEEMVGLNPQNLLNGSVVQCIQYNPKSNYLLIAYDDGGIDLLYDNGTVKYIPGLKMADGYSKKINNITFDLDSDVAWLATDFGYITINCKKAEIGVSRDLGRPLSVVAPAYGRVFIAYDFNAFHGDPKATSLDEFTQMPVSMGIKSLIPYQGKLYFASRWDGSDRFGYIADRDDEGLYRFNTILWNNAKKTGYCKSGIFVNGDTKDVAITPSGNPTYDKPEGMQGLTSSWNLSDFWISRGRKGLERLKAPYTGHSEWTITATGILPNAANAFMSDNMVYSDKYGMLVRNHGNSPDFAGMGKTSPDLISSLKSLTWTPLSATYRLDNNDHLVVYNPNGVSIDPRNADHVYCGSVLQGMLRLNLADPAKSMRFGRIGDPVEGNPQFVGVTTNCPDFDTWSNFSIPHFDNNGYMWVGHVDYNRFNTADGGAEVWVWSPEDRAATTSAANYRPMTRLSLPGFKAGPRHDVWPLLASANKGLLMGHSGAYGTPLVLLDYKSTPLDASDDNVILLSSKLIDQDGNQISYDYITAFYEDLQTGYVWLGSANGLFYVKPSELLTQNDKVYRVKVARNDGTQLADYLLDGVRVTDICQDASGRKWFATRGAGLVCTTANGVTVVKTYTTDNSQIPDNDVEGVAYNPANNSMMVSTRSGLAELFLSTSSENGESQIKAYPNPVRPDYFGYVTIEGVEDGALVKITDHAGNLIKELGFAQGGTATWDVTNLWHKRVPAGVYYVLASAGNDDTSNFAAVTKILVVN